MASGLALLTHYSSQFHDYTTTNFKQPKPVFAGQQLD